MPSRLLLDENLSERLLLAIDSLFPGSRHVRGLGRQGAADTDVWDLALQGDFVILMRIPGDGEQRFHGIVNTDSTAT